MPAIGSTTAGLAASAGLYPAPIGNVVTVRSKEDSMRFRVAMFPVAIVATLGLTAAAAFGATIMVDSDGAATPTNCAGGAPGSEKSQGAPGQGRLEFELRCVREA